MQDRPERRTVPVDGLDGCTLTVREPTNRERMEQWLYATDNAGPKRPGGQSNIAYESALWEYRSCVVVDWGGFIGEDGQPLQFNPRTFNAALAQVDGLHLATVKACNDAFNGVDETEAKN